MRASRSGQVSYEALQLGGTVAAMVPVTLLGLGLLAGAVANVREGRLDKSALALFFFLLVMGSGLAVLAVKARPVWRARQRALNKQAHPDAPWLWRKDWARGLVEHSERKALRNAWLLGGPALLVAVPLVIALVQWFRGEKSFPEGTPLLLVVAYLFIRAVNKTRAYRRQGVSVLALDGVPATVGGTLRGTLYLPVSFPTDNLVQLKLACRKREQVERRRGTRRRSVTLEETTLWDAAARGVPTSSQWHGLPRTAIPVSFEIPAGAQPCDEAFGLERLWVLEVSAGLPGRTWQASFEVPVFNALAASRPHQHAS